MNFKIFLKSLRGKNVFVWGLGLNGGGLEAVKFFCQAGAKVTVVDAKSKKELKETIAGLKKHKVNYRLGAQTETIFEGADLIIKNPAIYWENDLVKKLAKKYAIETDVTLFFKLFKGKIIGVTGSKGKTTTTMLLAKILEESGRKILLGGNLRVSLFSFFKERDLEDNKKIAVLEMSSFQLEDLGKIKKSPNLSVVTNILRDHLNRYGTYRKYVDAKLNICRFQSREDLLALNANDRKKSDFSGASKSKKIYFGHLGENKEIEKSFELENKILKTAINLRNISAVTKALKAFMKIKDETIIKALKKFKGVPYRMERVREVGGVTFINDTTATIPDATVSSIKDFEGGLVLIAGGADKDLKFTRWAKLVAKKVKYLVLIKGSADQKIAAALKNTGKKINFSTVLTMDKAVKLAYKKAVKGDTVLLSPGCASFGAFVNEFDRGDQFNKAVKSLK